MTAELPIRPEVVRAVAKQMGYGPVAVISVFCEAEGLTVERMDRRPNIPSEPWIPEQRLVGPWRSTREAKR